MSAAQPGGAAAFDRALLIVAHHFPPSAASGSHRLLGFVRHLGRYGWGTAVISPPTTPHEPVDAELARRVPPETGLYPAPFPWTRALRPLRSVCKEWCYAIDVRRWSMRVHAAARRALRERPIRAVLTSGPPHDVHAFGLELKRRRGLAWVADFRDPWVSGDWARGGNVRPRPWEVRLERRVMAEADLIVSNAPTARDALRGAVPAAAGRVVAVTNGYDPEAFEGLSRRPDPEGRWTIVHPGQLYLGRDPRPLFDALRGLLADWPAGRPPPRVRFLGDMGFNSTGVDLAGEARARGLEGVVALEGQVPHRASLQAMVDADALLLLDAPGRRIGVPAKLYEYLGAGRPVLALAEPDGDTAAVLRAGEVPHRLAPIGDAAAIGRALRGLLAEGPGAAPGAGRLEFTRERLAGRLAEYLDGIAAVPGRPRAPRS